MELDTVVCGDCLDVMKDMPDGCVDLVIADLPYGMTACKWDTKLPLNSLWKQFKRLLRSQRTIVLFGSQPYTSELIMSNLDWFKYELIWNKCNVTGHLNAKYRPMKQHENILIFGEKRACVYNPQMEVLKETDYRLRPGRYSKTKLGGVYGDSIGGWRAEPGMRFPKSIIKFNSSNSKGKMHPTQKPIPLLEYLIKTFSNPDELVFDCVMGSGTTAVAAARLNRHFYGCDTNPEYIEIANKRIEKVKLEMAQMEMF